MSNVPADRKYRESHEWVLTQEDGTVRVGISDHAQGALGDLVYVELPQTGDTVALGDAVAVVESTKAASDVYSPIDGEIVEVNQLLVDAPETLNSDPYDQGWIMRIDPANREQLDDLLDANAYSSTLEA